MPINVATLIVELASTSVITGKYGLFVIDGRTCLLRTVQGFHSAVLLAKGNQPA
jgi:hypothetical protein